MSGQHQWEPVSGGGQVMGTGNMYGERWPGSGWGKAGLGCWSFQESLCFQEQYLLHSNCVRLSVQQREDWHLRSHSAVDFVTAVNWRPTFSGQAHRVRELLENLDQIISSKVNLVTQIILLLPGSLGSYMDEDMDMPDFSCLFSSTGNFIWPTESCGMLSIPWRQSVFFVL